MTSETTLRRKRGQLMISLSLVALSLGACSKRADQLTQPATAPPLAALPLATAEPPAFNPAPEASQLPWPARPIRVAQRPRYDRYGYVDDAYDMGYGFADAPPDYAFDYDGSEPWAWRAEDGAYRIVEWLPDGERVYYYEPNDYYPFFVSDPDYSYAYDDGELVGLYDPYGYPLDDGTFGDRAYNATRYFNRGRDLYRAAIYQPRRSAYAENWLGRRDYLRGQQQRWDQGQARDPDWRSWRSRHQGNESRWRPEHDRRMSYAMASAAGWSAVRNRMEHRGPNRGGQQQSAGFGDRHGFDGHGQPQPARGWQHNAGNGFLQRQQAMTEQGRRGGWQHGQPMTMAPLHQTRDGRFAGNGLFAQRQADRRGGGPGFRTNQQRWQQANRPGGQQRFADNRFFGQHQMVEQRQRGGWQQAMQQHFVQRQQQDFVQRQQQERQRGGWQRAMEQRFVQRQQQQQQRGGWQQAMQQRFVQRQQQERQGGGWQQAAQARMVQQQQQHGGWQQRGGGQQHGGWQQPMQARAQPQPQRQAPSNNFARFAQAGGGPQHGNGGGGGSGNPWGGHHGHH